MKINIGIIGSSSFIGHELIKMLVNNDYEIYLFTRKRLFKNLKGKNINYINGKFIEKDLSKFINKIDILINLVAETNDTSKMYKTNVGLLKKVISAAKSKILKIIHISSVSVYGNNNGKILKETSKCFPNTKYGITKYKGENLLIQASKKNYFKSIIIRPSTILGKNMKNQSILQMISSIYNNKFFYFENQTSMMNYIYVQDLCKIIIKLIRYNKFKKYEILNFSNRMKLIEFVQIIKKRLNKNNKFINLPYKLVFFISYFYFIYNKFPLKPSRVKALNVKASYSNKKIAKIININQYNNLKKGIIELVDKFNEKKNLLCS
jgi:nucleoside-diphosphate-sugar epimerase